MKKLLIICVSIMTVFSISHNVFALSYELDVNQDGKFDNGKKINAKPGDTLKVDIWLTGYTCPPDNKLFGTQFYLQYDPAKVQFNSENSFINDSKHGGTFDPALGGIKVGSAGVYFLVASNFNHVTVTKAKTLLATIELKYIAAGQTSIKVANKLGFNGFDDGFVSNCNLKEEYPTDAVVTFHQQSKQPSKGTGNTKTTPPASPDKAAPTKNPDTNPSPGTK